MLAIREGPKFGNNQPLDLILRFWQFFHDMGLRLTFVPIFILMLVQESSDLGPKRLGTQ